MISHLRAVSKSQADKAGSKLAKALDPDSPELEEYSAVIDEWRALHGAPLIWVAESLQNRAKRVCRQVAVGQRLKRKPQIVAKLRRGNTRLAQMPPRHLPEPDPPRSPIGVTSGISVSSVSLRLDESRLWLASEPGRIGTRPLASPHTYRARQTFKNRLAPQI